MSKEKCRIGVVAPASRMSPEVAERVQALAASLYPDRPPEIFFHPQCFASFGHFPFLRVTVNGTPDVTNAASR